MISKTFGTPTGFYCYKNGTCQITKTRDDLLLASLRPLITREPTTTTPFLCFPRWSPCLCVFGTHVRFSCQYGCPLSACRVTASFIQSVRCHDSVCMLMLCLRLKYHISAQHVKPQRAYGCLFRELTLLSCA